MNDKEAFLQLAKNDPVAALALLFDALNGQADLVAELEPAPAPAPAAE